MIRAAKRTMTRALRGVGALSVCRDSTWRRRRLVILCYHGISLDDEHLWNPELYISPEHFESRLKIIAQGGYNVLPLDEAVERLYTNELPPRSVTLTFDDGTYDFLAAAHPILKRYGFPATVYLTTYYVGRPVPVFNTAVQYVLWKSGRQVVDVFPITGVHDEADVSTKAGRWHILAALRRFSDAHRLEGNQQDALVRVLANLLGVDYGRILNRRLLQLLSEEEVRALHSEGVRFELHTHRHRTPVERSLFLREIDDNRNHLRACGIECASHFCYPSGVHRAEMLPWLSQAGIRSATTTDPGIATLRSDPLLLPRLVDTSLVSPIEFEGWLSGVGNFAFRRQLGMAVSSSPKRPPVPMTSQPGVSEISAIKP